MTGDVFHIPGGAKEWWFTGYVNSGATLPDTAIWHKPRGISFVGMIAIGGGGGGGSPANRASGAAGAGAGGGASGAFAAGVFQAHLLPDTLYIRVGFGGRGATSVNSSGSNGVDSYVFCRYPDGAENRIIFAGFGSGGAAAGTAGTGGGAAIASMRLASLGVWIGVTGQNGSAGTSAAVGADVTPNTSGPTCGGAAGGGTSIANAGFAGGNILAGYFPQISGGAGTGVAGADGIMSRVPLIGTGGAGGGGSGTAGGGKGGDASGYGCGGGGGGSGTTGVGGSGLGGNGGPGVVLITAW